ncbi:uncharacterized protein LOC126748259 [Anthonomus grandis grandis]|uniref:uncharacterized protein LOC126748259 n=1 Tax=Anthonomus grandis grandis TaxID=2921223 RepID=UPI002165ED0F|nr:uncharacterized protein LOC126748259 [Anthonomus grandis grandis]
MFKVMDFLAEVSRSCLLSRYLISLLLVSLVAVLILPTGEGKLIGDHVCQTELIVPKEEQIWELKNRTIRTYKWCLNVPPRCAEYSTRLVNESKIVVVNVTKPSEICCNGFKEYKNYCVSECADCENGVCIKGFCVCQAGWTGPECNSRITTTDSTTSISSTTFRPLLDVATVTSKQEELFTSVRPPVILTTRRIENSSLRPILSTTTQYTAKVFNTSPDIVLKVDSIFPLSTTKPYTTVSHIQSFSKIQKNQATSVPTKITIPMVESTTTQKSIKMDELEGSGSKVTQNWPKLVAESTMMFDATDQESGSKSSEPLINQSNQFDQEEYDDNNYEEFGSSFESIESDDKLVQTDVDLFKEGLIDAGTSTTPKPTTPLIKPSLNKNLADNENSILKEHLLKDLDDFISERHEEHSSLEEMRKNTKYSIENAAGKNLIYSICAAALTTFLILVAAVTMYSMKNSRKKLEKEKSRTKRNGAGVAVYTTSIFHSPLPDPPTPTCENPIYPLVVSNESLKRKSISQRETMEIQEFNVVFHKPIKNPKLDTKLYLYDHPPSTGSYRASSEVDTLSQYNFSQRSQPEIITEPVYDEIPSKDPFGVTYVNTQRDGEAVYANSSKTKRESADASCLYMNTCRTKF